MNIVDADQQAQESIALERIQNCLKNRIEEIDLSGLGLRAIPADFFKLSFLKQANLSNNDLTHLAVELSNFHELLVLDISRNGFASFPSVICEMVSLEFLDVSGNSLTGIEPNFSENNRLLSLSLNDNELDSFPDSILALKSLVELKLSNNKIATIPVELGRMKELTRLSLANNSLISLPESLRDLTKLEVLDIEKNSLSHLPEFISYLKALELLDISANKISEIPVWISNLNKLQAFYMSDNDVEELPEDIGQLELLSVFSAARNRLRKLPDSFGKLSQLERIFLWGNEISVLPTNFGQLGNLDTLILAKNNFSEIPASIFELGNLQQLLFFENSISTIPEGLTHCQKLVACDLFGNRIESVPDYLCRLPNIKRLNLAKNLIKEVPSLQGMASLEFLDVSRNAINELPLGIASLENLQYFNLEDNDLEFLPDCLLQLKKLRILNLHGNKRLELPSEILGERTRLNLFSALPNKDSAHGILIYYFARRAGTRPLNEMKLVVVGRGAVGKTSLLRRIVKNEFDLKEQETPGIEITSWNVEIGDSEAVRLHAWDFGGQEILHATHQFFFSERCLYLLVLAGRDGQQQSDAEYWLQLIGSFGGDSKVIVVLNKSDEHRFDLNRQTLFDKYPGRIVSFYETDCLTRKGIENLKEAIRDQVISSEHRRTPFPAVWFGIKESLTKVESDYYSWDAFVRLCKEMGENDPEQQQILAEYLHALGIALNYSKDFRLADTHVLNPRWVTEGVYSLIRNGQRTGSPSINCNKLGSILNKDRYPRAKHDFLLRLMELYQLCFKLPNRDSIYLIPELLPRNQPPISNFIENCDLAFYYSYSVLPEGLLPRFIVQTHNLSEGYERWRSGVRLHWDDCDAVVVADAVDKFVKIYITGPRARCREFLAVIRQNFEIQHQSLKGISISEKIPLRNHSNVLLDYRDLLKRENRREENFYPENMDDEVNVRDLLDGIESVSVREERRKKSSLKHGSSLQQVFIVDGDVSQIIGDVMQNETKKGFQQITGGVFNNSAVIANAEVFKWQSSIDKAESGEIKLQLQKLNLLVQEALKHVPPESIAVISKNMEIFSEQAAAKEPDRDYLQIAARKLSGAVQSITGFSNPILEAVEKIVGLIN